MIECPTLAFLQNKSLTNITGDALFLSDTARKLKPKLSVALILIHDCNRSHNPVFDQSNKFVNSAIAPAQVLSAPRANAE
jgi:hypothetical protein